MFDSINWGLMRDGATFQGLANALVLRARPGAQLFTRPGRDGGQDARAGRAVYQAKFHQDRSAGRALADAREEARKIPAYMGPGHKHAPLWKGVREWVLVTNCVFNAANRQQWDREIRPLFRKTRLDADLWDVARVEDLLAKNPDVRRLYFEGRTRAFACLSEARLDLVGEEHGGADFRTPFFGREAELSALSTFLRDDARPVMLLHGEGGVGKTRLAYEAACRAIEDGRIDDALWVDQDALMGSDRWYEGIVPERRLLLVLDDPARGTVRRLAAQLRPSAARTARWKLAIVSRAPDAELSELEDLRSPRLRPAELRVDRIANGEAQKVAGALLAEAGLPTDEGTVDRLVRSSDRIPVWMHIAVRTAGAGDDLPGSGDMHAVADRYLAKMGGEIEGVAGAETVMATLRAMALFQPVNVEDKGQISSLAAVAGIRPAQARDVLVGLSNRQLVRRRGISKRLFEVRPDVLRDRLLVRWLLTDDRATGRMRVSGGGQEALGRLAGIALAAARLDVACGRLEMVSRRYSGGTVDLLAPLAASLDRPVSSAVRPEEKLVLLHRALAMGRWRPAWFAGVARSLRTGPTEPSGRHQEIILSLAWPLFQAGAEAAESAGRAAILDELHAVAREEADLDEEARPTRANDGKRAAALIPRLVQARDRRAARTSYADEAFARALNAARSLCAAAGMSDGEIAAAHAMIAPFVGSHLEETYVDGNRAVFGTRKIVRGSPDGDRRRQAIEALWEAVGADDAPAMNRKTAWLLLARAHADAGRTASDWLKAGSEALRAAIEELGLPQPEAEDLGPLWKAVEHASSLPEKVGELVDEARLAAGQADWLRAEQLSELERIRALLKRGALGIPDALAARQLWDWHARFDGGRPRAVALECGQRLRDRLEREGLPAFVLDAWERDRAAYGQLVREEGRRVSGLEPEAIADYFRRALGFAACMHPPRESEVLRIAEQMGTVVPSSRGVSGFVAGLVGDTGPVAPARRAALRGVLGVARDEGEVEPLRLLEELLARLDDSAADILMAEAYAWSWAGISLSLRPAELDIVESYMEGFSFRQPYAAFAALGRFVGTDASRVLSIAARQWDRQPRDRRSLALAGFVDGVSDRLIFDNKVPVELPDAAWGQIVGMVEAVPDLDDLGDMADFHLGELAKRFSRLPFKRLVSNLDARFRLSFGEESRQSGGRFLPHGLDPCDWFEGPDPESGADRAAAADMVGWHRTRPETGCWLPSVIATLDPTGAVFPPIVAGKIGSLRPGAGLSENLAGLAAQASKYEEGGGPWRAIAAPACEAAARLPQGERRRIYASLTWSGPRSWGETPGELHPRWQTAIDAARKALGTEQDDRLKAYWVWKLGVAEAELRHERERLEECQD